jgi:hypothetical protein
MTQVVQLALAVACTTSIAGATCIDVTTVLLLVLAAAVQDNVAEPPDRFLSDYDFEQLCNR